MKPTLYVEGKDDLFVIANLLKRHGVDMDNKAIHITEAGNLDQLLDLIADAILAATDKPLGFVIDIDVECSNRWQAVRDRLKDRGIAVETSCPETGFIGQIVDYRFPYGIWLMPNCSMDGGKLEHLIETLVPIDDQLWPHAKVSTHRAIDLGAKFTDPDKIKAIARCWLAWQQEPGLPFGAAINACFLNHRSDCANAFLAWLGRLFAIPQLRGLLS